MAWSAWRTLGPTEMRGSPVKYLLLFGSEVQVIREEEAPREIRERPHVPPVFGENRIIPFCDESRDATVPHGDARARLPEGLPHREGEGFSQEGGGAPFIGGEGPHGRSLQEQVLRRGRGPKQDEVDPGIPSGCHARLRGLRLHTGRGYPSSPPIPAGHRG